MSGLILKDVSKTFAGKLVVDKISFTLNQPGVYGLLGTNGAGKTTASLSILPKVLKCLEFVNADEIAKGLSPLNPSEVAIEAGRLMLQRVEELLDQRATFAIETTLATRSYKRLVDRAHELGYRVLLLFFWLPNSIFLQPVVERGIVRDKQKFNQILNS